MAAGADMVNVREIRRAGSWSWLLLLAWSRKLSEGREDLQTAATDEGRRAGRRSWRDVERSMPVKGGKEEPRGLPSDEL